MRSDPRELTAVLIGGAVGALARTALSHAFTSAPTAWPWTIFLINISGAFALGVIATRLQQRKNTGQGFPHTLLGTSFCGAFTTFSTMQLELFEMMQHHDYGIAGGYLAASLVCGYLAVSLASALTHRFTDTGPPNSTGSPIPTVPPTSPSHLQAPVN